MKTKLRRSGAKIMAGLLLLLGSLSYGMALAVVNGSAGFLAAMGVTVFGALGIAKALGETIALSWGWIIALTVGCGVVRGGLRYIEQYFNHWIAFRLLAVLRDRIFAALRVLCPAKLESKQKGSIIAMITADIETLEVFYAHTISPVCIAVLVSAAVLLFVGSFASWYLALAALAGYLVVGIVLPLLSSAKFKKAGVVYRREFASFNAYYLDSIRGIQDIVLNNAEGERGREVDRRSDALLKETETMKRGITRAGAATELAVSLVLLITLAAGIALVHFDMLSLGRMIVGVVAVFSSFGPVLAISALPGNLAQTFAGGDRVLDLLAEKPAVSEVTDGKDIGFERLDVSDLTFAYGNAPVLQDVCMRAEKGEIVGIVGESGCGKSTLLKLLLRFWEKQGGQHRIQRNRRRCDQYGEPARQRDDGVADDVAVRREHRREFAHCQAECHAGRAGIRLQTRVRARLDPVPPRRVQNAGRRDGRQSFGGRKAEDRACARIFAGKPPHLAG